MPYKSQAQRRFFHAAETRGDISHKTVQEFDKASKGKSMPERKKKSSNKSFADKIVKNYAFGGEVEDSDEEQDSKKKKLGEIINFPGYPQPSPSPKPRGYYDGGEVQQESPNRNREEFVKGVNESGFQPAKWVENLKESIKSDDEDTKKKDKRSFSDYLSRQRGR